VQLNTYRISHSAKIVKISPADLRYYSCELKSPRPFSTICAENWLPQKRTLRDEKTNVRLIICINLSTMLKILWRLVQYLLRKQVSFMHDGFAAYSTKLVAMAMSLEKLNSLYSRSKYAHTNPRWWTATIWKKSNYLHHGLTDCDKIWHSDASRPSEPRQLIKFCKFKNPRWRLPPSWKIKIAISLQQIG